MEDFRPILILVTLIILGVLARNFYLNIQWKKEMAKRREIYDRALSGTDKKAALEAGRAYYIATRYGNAITIYDEQAIANDLSVMK